MSLLDHLKMDPGTITDDLDKALKMIRDLGTHVVKSADLAGPDLTAGLRKLLEAKDCFVRAAIDVKDGLGQEGTATDVSQ